MNTYQIISISIFFVTFALIISEKIHRTVAALLGAGFLLLLQIIDQPKAISFIDFTTIGVLIGMMIIVSITKRTGLFQYLAIKSAKIAKGNPAKLILIFGLITGLLSAFLDNVTTVLLMAPVTLVIAKMLETNPIPFMMSEIMGSNIGGTATLIGDPPNIMIGSATKIGFMEFVTNLGPIVVIVLFFTTYLLKLVYRKELVVKEELKDSILRLDEKGAITDKTLLVKCLSVLFLVILGFFFHEHIGYDSSVVALSGAVLLLLISKADIEEIFVEIEWPTIFFFIGLFIIVGALVDVGIIEMLSKKIVGLTHGDLVLTGLLILWLSAILSAFLDNIPFVATMIPLIQAMSSSMNVMPLWWALSLGACLGGNGTLIGASANVIVAGILEREGYKLSFKDFMKIAFPLMIISILFCSIYLLLFYLR